MVLWLLWANNEKFISRALLLEWYLFCIQHTTEMTTNVILTDIREWVHQQLHNNVT